MDFLKNIPTEFATQLARELEPKPGQIISMSLTKSDAVQITLLAFPQGEGISEESYFGDTLYYVLEGDMRLVAANKLAIVKTNECIAVPAHELHALEGDHAFKILQITIQS